MIENVVNHSKDLEETSTKVLFSEPIGWCPRQLEALIFTSWWASTFSRSFRYLWNRTVNAVRVRSNRGTSRRFDAFIAWNYQLTKSWQVFGISPNFLMTRCSDLIWIKKLEISTMRSPKGYRINSERKILCTLVKQQCLEKNWGPYWCPAFGTPRCIKIMARHWE